MTVQPSWEKFATQIRSAMLADLRAEGRSLQSLVEEAVGRLIAERRGLALDVAVRDALKESMARYGAVYRRLAESRAGI